MKIPLLLAVVAAVVESHRLCDINPAATVGPNDPRLPQMLPPSFQVDIEATIIDRGMTLSAVEYFDEGSGRSTLMYRQNGQLESIYVNKNTNESYHIIGDNCTVHNQVKDYDDVFVGGQTGGGMTPHSYSTGAVLRFAQKYGEIYIGQRVIRGVNTDHWQSCMYWDFIGANFTLDYYFTAKNWSTSDGSLQIPVRAEVQGYNNMMGPGPGSSFHHVYDYVNFKNYVDDITNLETPKGTVCPGRKHTRAMPQLKPQFQYREEITLPGNAEVLNIDVYYDYGYKLVRYDHKPTQVIYPYYSLDDVTEIHDYNTGVAYIMDNSFLNCTIFPIENNTWDASSNSTGGLALGLKRPEQLFYIDPTYAYSGQRKARGILCDVFSTINTNFASGGLKGLNVVFEVYFMAKGWISDNDIGVQLPSTDIPVRMEISEKTTSYYAKYDFYDFDQENPLVKAFDISLCYSDSNEIQLELTFPGNYNDFLWNYRNLLERLSLIALARATYFSPIRIQNIGVNWDNQHAYLTATLLDISPPLARYRRWPKLVATYNDDVILNISTATLCAASCSIQQRAICNSFDVCPQAGTCALSLKYTSDGKELHASDSCDHFSRVLSTKSTPEVALTSGYGLLQKVVNAGKYVIPIKVPALGVNQVFKASSITQISYGKVTGVPVTQHPPHTNRPQTSGPHNNPPYTNKPGPTYRPPYNQHTGSPNNKPLCSNNSTPSSSDAGVIAGVAIAMLALGLIIGAGGAFVYSKKNQSGSGGPSVAYSINNPNYDKD